MHDLIIVGGGPIGLACGIEAKKKNLSYLIFDKGTLVNSLYVKQIITSMRKKSISMALCICFDLLHNPLFGLGTEWRLIVYQKPIWDDDFLIFNLQIIQRTLPKP